MRKIHIRCIANIDYDNMNNPIRIQFANGRSASRRVTLWYRKRKKNVTRYVYSAAGEKLRAVHETAVPNINVPVGHTH